MPAEPATTSYPRRYRAFGLLLECPFTLKGLEPVEASPGGAGSSSVDRPASLGAPSSSPVRLVPGRASRFERGRAAAGVAGQEWFQHAVLSDGSTYLCWTDHFEFVVAPDADRVLWRRLRHGSRRALETYLLGQVLSFVLLARGLEPLHATAVVIDGAAVALVGDCGVGKSTLAASFLRAGYPLLTDDLLTLHLEGQAAVGEGSVHRQERVRAGGHVAHPGLPRIKLYPEVARMLLPAAPPGKQMNDWTAKRIIPLGDRGFHRRPVPLEALYLLFPPGERPGPVLRRLSGREAYLELMANTYNPLVETPARLRHQFRFFTELVDRVPATGVHPPGVLERVDDVRDEILAASRSARAPGGPAAAEPCRTTGR